MLTNVQRKALEKGFRAIDGIKNMDLNELFEEYTVLLMEYNGENTVIRKGEYGWELVRRRYNLNRRLSGTLRRLMEDNELFLLKNEIEGLIETLEEHGDVEIWGNILISEHEIPHYRLDNHRYIFVKNWRINEMMSEELINAITDYHRDRINKIVVDEQELLAIYCKDNDEFEELESTIKSGWREYYENKFGDNELEHKKLMNEYRGYVFKKFTEYYF